MPFNYLCYDYCYPKYCILAITLPYLFLAYWHLLAWVVTIAWLSTKLSMSHYTLLCWNKRLPCTILKFTTLFSNWSQFSVYQNTACKHVLWSYLNHFKSILHFLIIWFSLSLTANCDRDFGTWLIVFLSIPNVSSLSSWVTSYGGTFISRYVSIYIVNQRNPEPRTL